MRYALLIYSDEGALPENLPAGEREKFRAEFEEVAAAMREAGAFVTSMRLNTIDTATTQRVRNGRVLTTDGPYAETKEALAGIFVLDCADADQALAWAARIPMARMGSIEVRPAMPCGE